MSADVCAVLPGGSREIQTKDKNSLRDLDNCQSDHANAKYQALRVSKALELPVYLVIIEVESKSWSSWANAQKLSCNQNHSYPTFSQLRLLILTVHRNSLECPIKKPLLLTKTHSSNSLKRNIQKLPYPYNQTQLQ